MLDSVSVVDRGRPTVLVFGHFADKGAGLPPDPATRARASALGVLESLAEAAKRPEATGEAGSVVEGAPVKNQRVLIAGFGDKGKCEPGTVRRVAAAVARRLAAIKAQSAALEWDGVLAGAKLAPDAAGNSAGEALGLLSWNYDELRGKGTSNLKRPRLSVIAGGEFGAGLRRGLALAEAANICRTLSQTPPNIATPEWMAGQARRVARKAGLACRVFEGADLQRERFEGLINVGKASENKPCMIRLEYTPKGGSSRSRKPIVLIGKTLTYDTGGLSLKVNNSMVGMKRDKDGGCAVLGAMHAIGTLIRPRRPVVALLPAAENSISDEAFRPDDVLRYRNGVTVEVTNTDAEGRLVLADALCWACEKENPAAIIDLATLTGGVITALGGVYCGMFCEDDALRARLELASARSGERVWRLPLHEEYREMMKSPVADIINSNPNRKAHPIQGAAFLSYFVREGIPWCHLDIAGVHVAEKNAGMFTEGPTGWGVRLLAELLDAD